MFARNLSIPNGSLSAVWGAEIFFELSGDGDGNFVDVMGVARVADERAGTWTSGEGEAVVDVCETTVLLLRER